VLLGRLARYLSIPEEKWTAAIEQVVNPKFWDINKKAFDLGFTA